MSARAYNSSGVLQYEWNDNTRIFSDFTTTPTTTRPYTVPENALADSFIRDSNSMDISSKMATVDLPAVQTIIADTNANINSNAAARIKDLAVAVRRLEKAALKQFDTP